MKKISSMLLVLMLTVTIGWQSTADDVANANTCKNNDNVKATVKTGFDAWRHRMGCGDVTTNDSYVTSTAGNGYFRLVANKKAAPLVVSDADYPGVIRAVGDLQTDICSVTRVQPAVSKGTIPSVNEIVLIGTIGKSPLIDQLIKSGKLNVNGIEGRWETFLLQVIDKPLPGVRRALVIAGSDKRGTIYGIYDLSSQIGISPWHFWDDVPARQQSALYITPGRHTLGEPAVKYRGFFINDENPALGEWAPEYFGLSPNPNVPYGFNHDFYAKIFEVLLRLKGNYLWPAVWGRSLFDDDPENQKLADDYGIVMGTSHEAPCMRAQDEWNRYGMANGPYGGNGNFSFRTNADALIPYWRDGLKRMKNYDSIITIGMRGNGDTGLEDGFAMQLMNDIVTAQRNLIAEVTGKDVTTVPQVWTLYKEVQRYWDEGMSAPDDVTIVWCDDNWGNIRELPDQKAPERSGGYGIYYHFDYVGGGRNYKWIDTNLLPNIWEQMHLAYEYGVDRLWVVNVGDMKNEEVPLQYFLDYAWSPKSLPVERIPEWEKQWATQQFGDELAPEIADLLHTYANLQSDRKPELLNRKITLDPNVDITKNPDAAVIYADGCPFSLTDYRELERVVEQWQQLAVKAEKVRKAVPANLQDAYYELAYYEIKASALMYELRLAGFKNILYKAQGRATTNDMAAIAQVKFDEIQAMAKYYNTELAGGKWKNFQTQPFLAYGGPYPNSSWQQPETNNVADPDYIWPYLVYMDLPAGAEMGVAIDGSDKYWPAEQSEPVLPSFNPYQQQPTQYIEVFNRGSVAFNYKIQPSVSWLSVYPNQGAVEKEVRANVTVDWFRAPKGKTEVPITVTGPNGSKVVVKAVIENPVFPEKYRFNGFVESNGYVSVEADHYTRAVNTSAIYWKLIPDIGRTGNGMTPFPVDAPRQAPGGDSPRLEYKMQLFNGGDVKVWVYLSPRNNVLHTDGLKYAVSIDDAEPQIVNVTTTLNGIPMNKSWERNTSDNVNLTSTIHKVSAGAHVLKFWMVDPTVVLQKIVVDTGELKPSYLGAPESYYAGIFNCHS